MSWCEVAGPSGFVAALAFRIASLFQVSRRLRVVASRCSFVPYRSPGGTFEPLRATDLATSRSSGPSPRGLRSSCRAGSIAADPAPSALAVSGPLSCDSSEITAPQAEPLSHHPSIDLILQRPLPRCCHRFGCQLASPHLVPTPLFHAASPVFSADHRVTPGFPPLQAVEDSAGLLRPAADPRVRPVSPSPRWSPPRRCRHRCRSPAAGHLDPVPRVALQTLRSTLSQPYRVSTAVTASDLGSPRTSEIGDIIADVASLRCPRSPVPRGFAPREGQHHRVAGEGGHVACCLGLVPLQGLSFAAAVARCRGVRSAPCAVGAPRSPPRRWSPSLPPGGRFRGR